MLGYETGVMKDYEALKVGVYKRYLHIEVKRATNVKDHENVKSFVTY